MDLRTHVLELFNSAQTDIELRVRYYEVHAKLLKWASGFLRLLAAVAFVGGTMAPFVAAIHPEDEKSLWLGGGYALLGFAGVMLVIDQFFVVTRGWGRHIKARLSLEFLREMTLFEKARFEIIAMDEAKLAEILPVTLDKIVKIREDLKITVTAETDSWETDLTQAMKSLESKIGTATNSALTDLEKQLAKEKIKQGAIKVTIEVTEGAEIDAATVTLGEITKPLPKPFRGPVAFDGVPVGISTIRLTWKFSGEERRQEIPVIVNEGEIASLKFIIDKYT